MSMKEFVLYCNTAWTKYTLDYREKWPLSDSLNYYPIMHVGLFGQLSGKCQEILYVPAFMSFHNKDLAKKKKKKKEKKKREPLSDAEKKMGSQTPP